MNQDENIRQLTLRANALIEMGRPQQAIPLLQDAVTRAPNDATVCCQLASCYFRLEEWERALEFADRAVAANPEREWGHRLRGYVLVRYRGRLKEALQAAQEAARVAPNVPEALFLLVKAYLLCKQTKEAENVATRLLALAPDRALSHKAMAMVALKQGRKQEAEEHSRRALEIEPNDEWAFRFLGEALTGQERDADVIECYYQAARLNPENGEARSRLNATAATYSLRQAIKFQLPVTTLVWVLLREFGLGRERTAFLTYLLVLYGMGALLKYRPDALPIRQQSFQGLSVSAQRYIRERWAQDWSDNWSWLTLSLILTSGVLFALDWGLCRLFH